MVNRRSITVALLVLFASSVLAQDAQPKRKPTSAEALTLARAWLDAQRSYDQIPAMSVSVVHDQDLLWSGGFGFADPATKRPATNETLYSICSVSKLFTSIAVMQLRDEGKVALDDPLSKHLPWFTMKPAPDGGPVTIAGVLTHSSGLPRESDFPYWSGKFEFPTHEQVVERLKSQTALYPSDTYFQYSNLGLTLAGEVVAAVSGKPYGDYVRERILQPLGLRATYPEIPTEEKGKRLAAGFSAKRRDGTRAALPLFTTKGIAPAAGFASTVDDLAKFASWQFRLLSNGDDSVLKARTLREMHRVHFVDPDFETFWGLGFGITRRDDKVFVGHNGSCPGFRTQFLLKPDEKIGVTIMANASGVDVGGYARAVYSIVSPVAGNKESAPPALTAFSGSYDDAPWGGETIFFEWGGELASVSLPTMTPMKDMDRYRKVGEREFRRLRKDDALGESYVFEVGPDGKATGYWQFSNFYPRMR